MLRDPGTRSALAETLRDVDRLILLGDVIEFRQGPARSALAAATPVLRDLAQALRPESEVVIVPGNHDHRLLGGWLSRRALEPDPPPLGLESPVDWREDELLGKVAAALSGVHVRAAYPGVWLDERVYATHGHYADRHTTLPQLERLGAGAVARVVREPSDGPGRPEDYEATLAPLYAWIDTVAELGGPAVAGSRGGMQGRLWQRMAGEGRRAPGARLAAAAGLTAVIAGLNRAGIGPLRAELSGGELRRASLRAMGEVIRRLAAHAPHVIFGHTHRAGPLGGDDRSEWSAGESLLLNTGSWVYEPAFLGHTPERSPYRPGFCALLGDSEPPRLVNLLDGRPPRPGPASPVRG